MGVALRFICSPPALCQTTFDSAEQFMGVANQYKDHNRYTIIFNVGFK